jgi:hypothetical protein
MRTARHIDIDVVRQMFDGGKLSLRQIAAQTGHSETGILRALRRAGVDTSRATVCHTTVACAWCGTEHTVPRSRARAAVDRPVCCSPGCRRSHDWHIGRLPAIDRDRGRLAFLRATGHDLPPGHVIVRTGGDRGSTDRYRLAIMASMTDAVRYARAGEGVPVLVVE